MTPAGFNSTYDPCGIVAMILSYPLTEWITVLRAAQVRLLTPTQLVARLEKLEFEREELPL